MANIDHFLQRAARVSSLKEFEEANITRMQGKIATLEAEKAQLLKVQGLIDRTISIISANGIGKIESIVSAGLQSVFKNKNYKMVVEKHEGARGTSYRLRIRKGEVSGEALGTFGGGVSAVASFLLRVIMIKRFKLAKFIVIDEAFNNVSPRDQPMVSEMLQKLVKDHGYTIFMVTHQPGLLGAADKVYEATPHEDAPPTLRLLNQEEIAEYVAYGFQTAEQPAT